MSFRNEIKEERKNQEILLKKRQDKVSNIRDYLGDKITPDDENKLDKILNPDNYDDFGYPKRYSS